MHISVVPLANCAANIKIKKETTKFLARAYLTCISRRALEVSQASTRDLYLFNRFNF